MDMDEDVVSDDTPAHDYRLKQESAERIFRLLQFLSANVSTRKEVFERLAFYYKLDNTDMTDRSSSALRRANRMFERDISFLRNEGFEIQADRKRAAPTQYHVVQGSGPRSIFLFTQQEVDCLALLYTLFDDPNRYTQRDPSQPLPQQMTHHPYAEQILTLIEKLASTLPTEQKKLFDRWIRKPYVYFNLTTVTDYLPHRTTIDTIVRAISHRQQIAFTYYPTHRRQDTVVHEHIDPYYIAYVDGHFYLFAYAHKTNTFLEYRIDRIEATGLKEQPEMIDAEHRRHPIEFRFWINANLAKRGLSERWLTQTQEREESFIDENGHEQHRVLIRATAYNGWRICQQILKYGDKAELVEPESLREKMRETVERMQKLYQSK